MNKKTITKQWLMHNFVNLSKEWTKLPTKIIQLEILLTLWCVGVSFPSPEAYPFDIPFIPIFYLHNPRYLYPHAKWWSSLLKQIISRQAICIRYNKMLAICPTSLDIFRLYILDYSKVRQSSWFLCVRYYDICKSKMNSYLKMVRLKII